MSIYSTRAWTLLVKGVRTGEVWGGSIGVPQKLQDSQDDIVDITKAAGFRLLCVMQSACPINSNVCRLLDYFPGRHERCSRVLATVLPHVGKDGTIVSDIEARKDILESADVFWRYSAFVFR